MKNKIQSFSHPSTLWANSVVCLFLISQTYLLERIELFVAKVFAQENKQLKCHFLQPQLHRGFCEYKDRK